MGEVVPFPDRHVENVHFIPADDIGEWLYAIGFISQWIPDTAPPADVMRGFVGATSLHDGQPIEDVARWIERETGWEVLL